MNHTTVTLSSLADYLNSYLNPYNVDEKSYNGIQVANTGATIEAIATAVSASLETIEKAATLGVQALIVHHGIFRKDDPHPLIHTKYHKLKLLIEHNIALLAYHLPLDAHQEIGNNWKAAQDLGFTNLQPFANYNDIPIGVLGKIAPTSFESFKKKVESYYNHPATAVKVKDPIQSVAIVSGGADRFIVAAAQAGADCFITGRTDEPVWDDAHETGISFLGLGHYATETVGPRALAEHLAKHFHISCTFIKTDNPF